MIKKILGIIFSIILLPSFPCFGEQEEFPLFFQPEANITIDGINNDWPETVPFFIESDSQVRRGKRINPEEFQVTVRCFFDEKNMYIFAEFLDPVPLKNQYQGNDIYKGDSLEVYLGFREESRTSYGPNDFQFGISLDEKGSETWVWSTGMKLSDEELAVVEIQQGYTLELRVPLSNFRQERVQPGDLVWIDFAANNSIGEEDRSVQLVWNGDGEGWQNPQTWRKGKLYSDAQAMKAPYILTPPEFLPEKYHRVYIWYDGKPWRGTVLLGDQEIPTDERGGFDVISEKEDSRTILAKIDGNAVKTTIKGGREKVKAKMKKTSKPMVKKIKVNQLGYLPEEQKQFVLTDNDGKLSSKEFLVIDVFGGIVFRGTLQEGYEKDVITHDRVYYGDFSTLKTPGVYTIRVNKFGNSHKFTINNNVFSKLFYTTMRSYYLQRCGIAINDEISGVSHEICHTDDGVMRRNSDKTRDVTGGWHDAGDYGKYMPTAGVTVAQLLLLYELAPEKFAEFSLDIPESKNNTPDILDEVKYELDWMLTMQDEDGGIFHKVNTKNFPGMSLPENDRQTRYIYEKGTSDTGIFTGAIATAARVLQQIDADYAEKLRDAAIQSGEFLLKNLDKPVLWPSNDNTGAYRSNSVNDELFWAFAELYRLTGDKKYLNATLPFTKQNLKFSDFGWENTMALGVYALAVTEHVPEPIQQKMRDRILDAAEACTAHIQNNGYRVALSLDQYHWASNKVACAHGVNHILAYELFQKEEFRQAARYQLDYILGVNTLGKTFITGLGSNDVRYPHHRMVEALEVMVPGLLVGGPNTNAEDGVYKKGLGARGYVDDSKSYASNEYAIDYNAPLVFLAGYFME